MRILLLTHAFNSLTQRLFVELSRRGHALSVELDINDRVSEEAVSLFHPDIVLCPFNRRAIPESIWARVPCLIVHPGPPGDRGPSALDWAVTAEAAEWGVTVLQAEAALDGGPVWASVPFRMRPVAKSSLYRREVTEAAVTAVLRALERFASGEVPERIDSTKTRWQPLMRQGKRAIDWSQDDTETVLRKVRAADGFPGVHDEIAGLKAALFDAHAEDTLSGEPGRLIARRHHAVCRATRDGAVWITHLKPLEEDGRSFKRPAALALGEARLAGIPEVAEPAEGRTWREIAYEEAGGVGYLSFDFYNGAMSTEQCERLRVAVEMALARPTRVLALMGGAEFWSNGLHLGAIEAAASPADESWRNINAMDDLCRAVLSAEDKLVVAALRGNAGAGGAFLALAADRVLAAPNVVLNPHYKNMGNLYGSEYWTYVLPRRVGEEGIQAVMGRRLPLGAPEANAMGLIDACIGTDRESFEAAARARFEAWADSPEIEARVTEKQARRRADEAARPLELYREAELERMRLNFYGFDPSYHVARYNFIRKVPASRTPLYLACHRTLPESSGDRADNG